MYYLVYITCSNFEEAKKIGKKLIEERLAACVNIVEKIFSIYWWQGKIEEANEALLIAKTNERNLESLMKRVKELHSYTVPAILAIKIEKGYEEFLKWLDKETR